MRDHVAEALARLPGHLAEARIIRAIAQLTAERAQAIADAKDLILRVMDLSSPLIESYPWALAAWGELFATPRRAGWHGDQYRRILTAAQAARRSSGRHQDVLEVANLLRPPGEVVPAYVQLGSVYALVVIPGLEADVVMQEAAREILLRAITDVADLQLLFGNPENMLKFDTEGLGFDEGQFG